jgi:hypothetical protein
MFGQLLHSLKFISFHLTNYLDFSYSSGNVPCCAHVFCIGNTLNQCVSHHCLCLILVVQGAFGTMGSPMFSSQVTTTSLCLNKLLGLILGVATLFVIDFYLFSSTLLNDSKSHVHLFISLHSLISFAKSYFQLHKITSPMGLHEIFTPS